MGRDASPVSCRVKEIEPLLVRHGFCRTAAEFDEGSGGPFAEATFVRGDRSVTLWLRGQSLSVIYRCCGAEVDHLGYMRELVGTGGSNAFPTYRDDALASFRAVRLDLDRFGSDLLEGDGQRLVAAAKHHGEAQQMTPMQRLAAAEVAAKQRR